MSLKYLLTFLLVLNVSSCCKFVPCHLGTRAVGYVTDSKRKPIKGAVVTLYGYEQITDANGCFAFDVADALPFKLSASAAGFKTVEVPSEAGFFDIDIKLVPVNSGEPSEVKWKEINNYESQNIKPCT